MSLSIDVDSVREVLLADGTWHQVVNDSFELDAYEYLRDKEFKPGGGSAGVRLGGGQEKLLPATGARWTERDQSGNTRTVFCPITAIQAVSYGWSEGENG